MTVTEELLHNNDSYAATFAKGDLPLPPAKRVAVVACMDARLDPARVLGLEEGDAHVIRNAGGVVSDDAIRSLAISQRLLGTQEIILIHHTDCGMLTFTDDEVKAAIVEETGIRPHFALESFVDLDEDVHQSIARIKASPFVPRKDRVRGFVYEVETGKLRESCDRAGIVTRRAQTRSNTAALVTLIVLGLGVAAAPLIFSMFDRAPKGAEMIDEFRPFMTHAEIHKFRGFLAEMNAADKESRAQIDPAAAANLGLTSAEYAQRVTYLTAFEKQWPGINADMSDMLDRMQRNIGNYEGVDALPPFGLFPWFFVIPGLLVAGLSGAALVAARRGRRTRGVLVAVMIVGVGLVAAPAVFQMFTRGPNGGDMIDDFRPLMTRTKLTTIQGYFLTLGNGEAELRNVAIPAAALQTATTPAVDQFVADWPRIDREMAPFVGVMADNLENFAAVDALPPFALFPWFFVIPGVLIAGLGVVALRRSRDRSEPNDTGGSVSKANRSTVLTGALVAATLVALALGAAPAGAKAAKSTSLVGLFKVSAASCAADGAPTSGSYFRMVNPGGTVAAGPFIANADSTCVDKTYIALAPGTAGGLTTGKYQPQPNPPFDATGNGLAATILAPTKFFGVNFAVSTNTTDPQSSSSTKVPTITTAKGKLTGDLDAYSVAYGNQQFNQGSPKPDGSKPGATTGPTGTYSATSGKYTLDWSSAIVGGPFDGFTGVWHFEGTFTKKG